MSSRFVSSGTIGPSGGSGGDDDVGKADADAAGAGAGATPAGDKASSDAWETVQRELEAERRRREEQRIKAASGEEKSLYDILQENKGLCISLSLFLSGVPLSLFCLFSLGRDGETQRVTAVKEKKKADFFFFWWNGAAAKQAAFEEQNKIRNQFRALDDDEADFLDEVRARERREAEAVRRETEEGLRAFRARRKGAGGTGDDDGDAGLEEGGQKKDEGQEQQEEWSVGRKRKRVKDRDAKGVVRRKVGGGAAGGGEQQQQPGVVGTSDGGALPRKQGAKDGDNDDGDGNNGKPAEQKKPALGGLVGYGSDDSDDE